MYYPKSDHPEIHYNIHEPLMTQEEAREIQQTLAFNKRVGGFGTAKGIYPLTGLVQCAVCGAGAIISNGSKGKIRYFVCAKSRYKTCSNNKGTRLEKLDEAIINSLIKRAEAITNIAHTPHNTELDTPELQQLQSQLFSLKSIPGANPAIQSAITEIESQIIQLRYSLSQSQEINSVSRDLLLWAFSDPECWSQASDEDKKRVYRELVEKVIVKDGSVIEVKLKI